MKATCVTDIRDAIHIPGAIQFHAGKRKMFYTCPCGCGAIGNVRLDQFAADRKKVSINHLLIGTDGKYCSGDVAEIGILESDGGVHWAGTLQKGVWNESARSREAMDEKGNDNSGDDGSGVRIFLQDREEAKTDTGISSGEDH